MRILTAASQVSSTLKRCPAERTLASYKQRASATFQFALDGPVPICPAGVTDTFTAQIKMMTRTRSEGQWLIFLSGVVNNGPAHAFMFCALWNPRTRKGPITFHNMNDPERNSS